MNINLINQIISLGVIGMQVGIIVLLFAIFFKSKNKVANQISQIVDLYWLEIVFLISFSSLALSLFYSNVVGYAPCLFCWYQRIAMYPIVLMALIAFYKKYSTEIIDYALGLSIFGFAISAYQYYGQMFQNELLPCQVSAVSCAEKYFVEFGYITIPLMALTSFALLIVVLVNKKLSR